MQMEMSISEDGRKKTSMVREFIYLQTDKYSMDCFRMGSNKVKASISTIMVQPIMMVLGRTIKSMALVPTLVKSNFMKEDGNIIAELVADIILIKSRKRLTSGLSIVVLKMVTADLFLEMAVCIQEISLMICHMAKEISNT